MSAYGTSTTETINAASRDRRIAELEDTLCTAQQQLASERAKSLEIAASLEKVQQSLYVLADPHDLGFSGKKKRKEADAILSGTFGSARTILTAHDAEIRKPLDERITELERQLAKAKEDTADLDWLEREMRKEPLLLHNCSSGDDFPPHPRGLGLIPSGRTRTLREAIRAARKERG